MPDSKNGIDWLKECSITIFVWIFAIPLTILLVIPRALLMLIAGLIGLVSNKGFIPWAKKVDSVVDPILDEVILNVCWCIPFLLILTVKGVI